MKKYAVIFGVMGALASQAFAGSVDVISIQAATMKSSGLKVGSSNNQYKAKGAEIYFAGPEARALFEALPFWDEQWDEDFHGKMLPSRSLYLIGPKDNLAVEIFCRTGSLEYHSNDTTSITPLADDTKCMVAVIKPQGEFSTYRVDTEADLTKLPALTNAIMAPKYIQIGAGWSAGGSVTMSGKNLVQLLKHLPKDVEKLPNGKTKPIRRLQIKAGAKQAQFSCAYLNTAGTNAQCTILVK